MAAKGVHPFGDLLRHYRRQSGLTQEELAELAERAGLGGQYREGRERP